MGLLKKEHKKNTQMQEASLTLYASRPDMQIVPEILEKLFETKPQEVVEDDEKLFVVSLPDGSSIKFSVMANTQENAIQSNGMANYFAQAPLENEKVKDAAIQQILLFN